MCFDPISIGVMTSIAGTAVSAAGSMAQGKQQQALANAQARALEQQREAERRASSFEALKELRQGELAQSAARAQVGASGVSFAGSPTEVLTANAQQNQLDVEAIRWGSQIRENNLTTQAGISRMQGKAARSNGMMGAVGSIFSGVSSLYDPAKSLRLGMSNTAFATSGGMGGLY